PGSIIQFADILEVAARNDDHVAGMELPQVDDGHRRVVLTHDAGWRLFPCDGAKVAFIEHETFPSLQPIARPRHRKRIFACFKPVKQLACTELPLKLPKPY